MKDKKVDILGTPYQIKLVDFIQADEKGTMVGECDSALRLIRVCTKDKEGNPIPEELIKMNLCHELVHAMLNEGQYLAYSDDEPLVEWLGRNIYSLIKQKVL